MVRLLLLLRAARWTTLCRYVCLIKSNGHAIPREGLSHSIISMWTWVLLWAGGFFRIH